MCQVCTYYLHFWIWDLHYGFWLWIQSSLTRETALDTFHSKPLGIKGRWRGPFWLSISAIGRTNQSCSNSSQGSFRISGFLDRSKVWECLIGTAESDPLLVASSWAPLWCSRWVCNQIAGQRARRITRCWSHRRGRVWKACWTHSIQCRSAWTDGGFGILQAHTCCSFWILAVRKSTRSAF